MRFTKIQASVHLKTFKSCINTKWPLFALFSEMRSSPKAQGFDMKTLIGVVTGELVFSDLKELVDVNDLIKTKAKEYFKTRLELQKRALTLSKKRCLSEPALENRQWKRMKSPPLIDDRTIDEVDEVDGVDAVIAMQSDEKAETAAEKAETAAEKAETAAEKADTISFAEAVRSFVIKRRVLDGSNESRISIKAWDRLREEKYYPEIHDAVVDDDFYVAST